MRLGLYHTCLLEWEPERLLSWMEQEHLKDLELHGGPRYGHIDWTRVAAGDARLAEMAARHQVRIWDIMDGSLNFLHPDRTVRERSVAHAITLLQAAKTLRATSVSVFTGRDPALTLFENLDRLPTALQPVLQVAEDLGITLALENCPMAHDWPPRFNIAINPKMWQEIFERVSSPALGIAFDPSHLVWQGIDYVVACKRFLPRIALVQAKDSETLADVVAEQGILATHFWRHRIPGQGDVDWPRLLATLAEAGYDRPIFIEQEDPFFEDDTEAVLRGLQWTRRYLEPYLALSTRRADAIQP